MNVMMVWVNILSMEILNGVQIVLKELLVRHNL